MNSVYEANLWMSERSWLRLRPERIHTYGEMRLLRLDNPVRRETRWKRRLLQPKMSGARRADGNFPASARGHGAGASHEGSSGPVPEKAQDRWTYMSTIKSSLRCFSPRGTVTPQISCRRCGLKSQAAGAAFPLVLGWWGFPWGLVVTPVQIGRNIGGMTSGV